MTFLGSTRKEEDLHAFRFVFRLKRKKGEIVDAKAKCKSFLQEKPFFKETSEPKMHCSLVNLPPFIIS
jgi:hypothetical protein